jgi:hypothetical protein
MWLKWFGLWRNALAPCSLGSIQRPNFGKVPPLSQASTTLTLLPGAP